MRIDTFQVNVLHYLFGVPVTTFIFRRTKTVRYLWRRRIYFIYIIYKPATLINLHLNRKEFSQNIRRYRCWDEYDGLTCKFRSPISTQHQSALPVFPSTFLHLLLPSVISLMVSVDIKHHVYLLTSSSSIKQCVIFTATAVIQQCTPPFWLHIVFISIWLRWG